MRFFLSSKGRLSLERGRVRRRSGAAVALRPGDGGLGRAAGPRLGRVQGVRGVGDTGARAAFPRTPPLLSVKGEGFFKLFGGVFGTHTHTQALGPRRLALHMAASTHSIDDRWLWKLFKGSRLNKRLSRVLMESVLEEPYCRPTQAHGSGEAPRESRAPGLLPRRSGSLSLNSESGWRLVKG